MRKLGTGEGIMKVLQEDNGLSETRTINGDFGALHLYDSGARLYELNNKSGLKVFLTPDGVAMMDTLPRSTIRQIRKEGNLGAGKVIDKARSKVTEYESLGIVEKQSKVKTKLMNENGRLQELLNMENYRKQIEEINKANNDAKLRLEIPPYYGFASWKTPKGEQRNALFMKAIKDPSYASLSTMKRRELSPDLRGVLKYARQLGIGNLDTFGNIFVKTRGAVVSYLLIDQI